MTVPMPLQTYFDPARSWIVKATWFDAAQLVGNALACVETIRQYVVSTEALDRAFHAVVLHADDFKSAIAQSGFPSGGPKASAEQARQLVLLSLDRLGEALSDAKPNAIAIAMEQDWI